jgi:hypothetical protein
MPTHYAFRTLPLDEQLPLVWVKGTFLGYRRAGVYRVALYYMKGNFFCELFWHSESLQMHRLRTFTSTAYLTEYLSAISLDDLIQPSV